MSELLIASSEADAHATEAFRRHHTEMAGALRIRVDALLAGASRGDKAVGGTARQDLIDWGEGELLPHAVAEEQSMYPAARATVEGRLLVEAMLGEHETLALLVREVGDAADLVRAAASATALRALFDSHLAKENDLVLPLLAAAPGVSVAALLEGMHELLGARPELTAAQDDETYAGCGGHDCSCGEVDGPGHPELDVRSIPHAIRHATVFGALESVPLGAGLELVAPHDPLPLLDQISKRWPGVFTVAYLERGPVAWRISIERTAVRD